MIRIISKNISKAVEAANRQRFFFAFGRVGIADLTSNEELHTLDA